jgi:hypothetical protein
VAFRAQEFRLNRIFDNQGTPTAWTRVPTASAISKKGQRLFDRALLP